MFETGTKTLQKSQFPKPLKVSDTDHWLVAARHEEKAQVLLIAT